MSPCLIPSQADDSFFLSQIPKKRRAYSMFFYLLVSLRLFSSWGISHGNHENFVMTVELKPGQVAS